MSENTWSSLVPSLQAQRSLNVMDEVVHRISACTSKTPLKLSIGDPTYDGNLITPEIASQIMAEVIEGSEYNGYAQTIGYESARGAIAEYWGRQFIPSAATSITAGNVVISCGASEAVLMSFIGMADEGENILIPSPCFTQYPFVCKSYGIEARHYKLIPDRNWEVDIEHLRTLVDSKTKALLINNPSNPCGSNFSRAHIEAIIKLAEELKVPIISDEIYAGIVFDKEIFTSFADVVTDVPRLILGGLAKNFMVPGWRIGWIIQADSKGYLNDVMEGIRRLTTLVVGPNGITQGVMPRLLKETPPEYFAKNVAEMQRNARLFTTIVNKCHGLHATDPQGAMYVMVHVDTDKFSDIRDDVEFYAKLHDEENVQVIPGTYFQIPNYFRVVITRPQSILEESCDRIKQFCDRHKK